MIRIKNKVVVSAVCHEVLYGDFEGNTKRAMELVDKVAPNSDLVCLSYYWRAGHSDGTRADWLEDEIGKMVKQIKAGKIKAREMNAKLIRQLGEPIPNGEGCQILSEKAKQHGIYLVGGSMPEIDGDHVYHSSPIFGPNGEFIGKHRKTILWDREGIYVTPGNKLEIFDTEVGRLGIGICSETLFATEIPRIYALKGADIVLCPTGTHWSREMAISIPVTRALENQVFVVVATQIPRGWKYPSIPLYGTCIVSPYKYLQPVLALGKQKPCTVTATLDIKKLREDREKKVPIFEDYRIGFYDSLWIEGSFSYPTLKTQRNPALFEELMK